MLGIASLSKKIQNPTDEFGEIALNIEALKKFHKKFRKNDRFEAFSKKFEDCLSYKITYKDYKYDSLLAKVFYHEFGHLYFGHCNRAANNIKNPNEVRESYANFFASLVFDSQKKSTFIWIMTRFQLNEYKFPKLLKMSKDYDVMSDKSKISSFNCTLNKIKSFIDFAVEERELRIKNGGLHK